MAIQVIEQADQQDFLFRSPVISDVQAALLQQRLEILCQNIDQYRQTLFFRCIACGFRQQAIFQHLEAFIELKGLTKAVSATRCKKRRCSWGRDFFIGEYTFHVGHVGIK